MAKLTWDATGQRFYETGTDHGVLYVADSTDPKKPYPKGVVWNGLTAVSESPSGAESNPQYADNIKYVDIISAEEFKATIEAFTYPVEFEACDGTASPAEGVSFGQQRRKMFGFSYRTLIGNDTEGTEAGYKLHLLYGCQAAPSEKGYKTVNDSPEPIAFSWEVSTTPAPVSKEGYKPTASITINSTLVDPAKLASFEAILYGGDSTEAYLPLPDEVIKHFGDAVGV